jgi:hypothetical protein
LRTLPSDAATDLRIRNITGSQGKFATCLELHYDGHCGKLDPATICTTCGQKGTIIHGYTESGGLSLSDYNDNYISWCTRCYWNWYVFYIDQVGEPMMQFDYSTNEYR